MRRWLTDWVSEPKHRWLAGGALALLLFLLVTLGVAPRMVLSRLRERANVYGLRADAASARLGFGGVSLAGLTVGWPDGSAALVRIDSLVLDLNWTQLSDGLAALAAAHVEQAEINLTSRDLQRLAQTRNKKQSDAAPGASGKPRTLPDLNVRNLELLLTDESGALLRVVSGEFTSNGRGFQGAAKQIVVGTAPSDVVSLASLKAAGELHEGHMLVTSLSSEAGQLDWAEAVQAPTDGKPATARTLHRILNLRDVLRAPPARDAPAVEAAGKAHFPLKPGAKIELRNLRVNESPERGQKVALLDGLSVSVEALKDGLVRTRGKGSAPGSGELGWDLRLAPADLRVEGTLSLHDVSLGLLGPVLPPLPFHELAQTRVRAELELTGRGFESVAAKGAFSVRDLAFASDGLARSPVGPFGLDAKGEATWTPARRELSNLKANIKTGAVGISVAGSLAWPRDAYRVDFVADMPKSRCADVLAAVPAGLLDELATVELGGTLAAKLTVHVDATDLDATKVDFDIADACSFGMLPPLLDLGRFQRPFAHQVLEPDGTVFEMETGPGTPNWTPIEYVSPFFVQAVVSHEDGRFFGHRGFAEPEIGVALSRNLKAKAFKFGASTITMQLVKNVFLHRDKLLARKVQEALIVWWLEQHWDKRRILELYLNVIEYGPAIYGIRNASMHYFGVLPMDLTPAQAGFLACILPSPKSSHVHYEKGALSTSAKNRIANLLKHMQSRERIDAEALAYGLEELEHFRFYDPSQPPPVPPQVRGTAQKLPFNTAGTIIDPWESFLPPDGSDTGSFGNP